MSGGFQIPAIVLHSVCELVDIDMDVWLVSMCQTKHDRGERDDGLTWFENRLGTTRAKSS